MPQPRNPRPHFLLPSAITTTSAYRATNAFGRSSEIPERDRDTHARHLRGDLAAVRTQLADVTARQREAGWEGGFGLRVLFASFPDVHLALESLDVRRDGIELLNVRDTAEGTLATVWMPEGGIERFEQKLTDYLSRRQDRLGRPRDSRKLLDAIRDIRAAVVDDLWTDEASAPPDDQIATFEVWLSTPAPTRRRSRTAIHAVTPATSERVERFRAIAQLIGLSVSEKALIFPERSVVQVRGSLAQLKSSSELLGQIAELRFAPETAAFFSGLEPPDQQDWSTELLGRTSFATDDDDPNYVCVLDTGCSSGHPLLANAIDPADLHSIDSAWGVGDEDGHGTGQAGLAIWGDLTTQLAESGSVTITHRLESVKLLPRGNWPTLDHLGRLTAQAVSLPEISAPNRRRLFSMAVTSDKTVVTGRPTAWSAEIDALAADSTNEGATPRLFLISGGNVSRVIPGGYFSANSLQSIEDPANAWNALTVGAITHKTQITEQYAQAYFPIAGPGCLSPYSACSFTWRRDAPWKPDVVFEGGNMGDDGVLCSGFDSLSLLTTSHEPHSRHFTTTWATSAATAVASRFCARVAGRYPDFWPETIRGLVVHSANWSPGLERQFPASNPDQLERRLRHCGWGEPDIGLALDSGRDSLVLVIQSALQPYGRQTTGAVTAKDMHLHRLPWPRSALQELMSLEVELRVTLSYFVEPNPGERGRSDRFRYASHGLRFAVQGATETRTQFEQRINALARDEEDESEQLSRSADNGWLLGTRRRYRGSLHHDRLQCSAVELAAREHIAVYPVGGWWKSREALEMYARSARYALIVSVRTPETAEQVDLCTEVEAAIAALTRTIVPISV